MAFTVQQSQRRTSDAETFQQQNFEEYLMEGK